MSPPERRSGPPRQERPTTSTVATASASVHELKPSGQQLSAGERVIEDDALHTGFVPTALSSAFEYRIRRVDYFSHGDRTRVRRDIEALRRRYHAEVDRAADAALARWSAPHQAHELTSAIAALQQLPTSSDNSAARDRVLRAIPGGAR
jgi:hypothetical protein